MLTIDVISVHTSDIYGISFSLSNHQKDFTPITFGEIMCDSAVVFAF